MGGWARDAFMITPDGTVMPCHAAGTIPHLTFDNASETPLGDIWEHSSAFDAYRGTSWMPELCQTCERRDVDFGGCRCQALAVTGDAAATDPACSRSPLHARMMELAAQGTSETADTGSSTGGSELPEASSPAIGRGSSGRRAVVEARFLRSQSHHVRTRVSFVSLGCPKALVDSERIITRLRAEGYEIARKHDGADLVVVNTCGFLDSARDESLAAIGQAMSENGKVIVTGCMGATPDLIRQKHPNVLAITGPQAYESVMDAVHEAAHPRTSHSST